VPERSLYELEEDAFMVENQRRRLARQIVDRAGMARGVVVRDENVTAVAPALSLKGNTPNTENR
jgi:hypothetical protein